MKKGSYEELPDEDCGAGPAPPEPPPELSAPTSFYLAGPREARDAWASWLFFGVQAVVIIVG